jgi:hypothetical protein
MRKQFQEPAVFSRDRRYRYTLWREWPAPSPNLIYTEDPHLDYHFGTHDEFLQVIGLNCSVANETENDRTVARCIDFAQRWGFGGLCMTNLFAFCATDPGVMMAVSDPVGPENDGWLELVSKHAGTILCAWGNDGAHLGRADAVMKMLGERMVHCLGITKKWHPNHPLYIPAITAPKQLFWNKPGNVHKVECGL